MDWILVYCRIVDDTSLTHFHPLTWLESISFEQIDPLLTPTGKKLQDGTRAVARQIANDILPQLGKAPPSFPPSPESFQKVGNELFKVFSNQIQKNFEDLQDDLSDPINKIPQRLQRQTEDLAQEVKNAFLYRKRKK